MPVEHYLITIDLRSNGRPSRLHAYVMTDDERAVMGVVNKMVDLIETKYGPLRLPLILQTKLGIAAEQVRKDVCDRMEECRTTMAAATDFHVTMFELGIADPWDETLMKLH